MKIGFDAKRLFCNNTGLGNYSRTLVGSIVKKYSNNEYMLFSPKTPLTPETEPFTNRERFTVLTAHGLIKKLWRACGIKKDIRTQQLDLYHGLSHDLPFGKKASRYVVTIHDVCYKTFPAMFPWSERKIYELKYSNAVKKADKIVAISESTKNDILRYFDVDPSKIEVIYQALNPLYYTPAPMEQAQNIVRKYGVNSSYILYVGAINERKNLMGVVQAYNMLPAELRTMPLVVIGNGGKYKQQVMEYAMSCGVSEDLIIIDSMTLNESLQAFYQCAKMLVYPSFYEGFGLPVAEALLSGIPVITSRVSSLPEAAGDGALYIDPTQPQQITQAMEQLLRDDELCRSLATKGRAYVTRNFDPQQLTEQMMELYKTVCSN